MSISNPRRRLLDSAAGAPTLLAEQTHFIGNLAAAGAFVLCGRIEGDGRIGGALNVTASGVWLGNVEANSGVVAGTITGSIKVTEKLEIGKAAVIHGSVTAKTLAIAQGAVVDGDITVTGTTPIKHFEEKRAAR